MIIIVTSLPINVSLNYIFIFGKLGVPAYGGIGSGIATALTYWLVCIITVVIIFKQQPFRSYSIFSAWVKPSLLDWCDQLSISIQFVFVFFFHMGIFFV